MSSEGLADVWEDWQDAVNMSPRQLEEWSGTCTATLPNGRRETSSRLRGDTR